MAVDLPLPPFGRLICPWSWTQCQCVIDTQVGLLPLLVWSAHWGLYPALYCFWVAGALVSARRHLWLLSLSCPTPASSISFKTHIFRCLNAYIFQMCACWMGGLLMNYSFPTCYNFKGSNQEVSYASTMLTLPCPFIWNIFSLLLRKRQGCLFSTILIIIILSNKNKG